MFQQVRLFVFGICGIGVGYISDDNLDAGRQAVCPATVDLPIDPTFLDIAFVRISREPFPIFSVIIEHFLSLVFLVFRWMWIVAVAILVPDLSIGAVNDNFRFFLFCDRNGRLPGELLSAARRERFDLALNFDYPALTVRDDM